MSAKLVGYKKYWLIYSLIHTPAKCDSDQVLFNVRVESVKFDLVFQKVKGKQETLVPVITHDDGDLEKKHIYHTI